MQNHSRTICLKQHFFISPNQVLYFALKSKCGFPLRNILGVIFIIILLMMVYWLGISFVIIYGKRAIDIEMMLLMASTKCAEKKVGVNPNNCSHMLLKNNLKIRHNRIQVDAYVSQGVSNKYRWPNQTSHFVNHSLLILKCLFAALQFTKDQRVNKCHGLGIFVQHW